MEAIIVRVVEHRNVPFATAGAEASLINLSTSISWSIVTVNPLGLTTSPACGRVPPSHVAVFDQFPVATAYLLAIVVAVGVERFVIHTLNRYLVNKLPCRQEFIQSAWVYESTHFHIVCRAYHASMYSGDAIRQCAAVYDDVVFHLLRVN